jgi:hypothetical protein
VSTELPEDKRPMMRVITGNPSAEELAAILAIVASVVQPEDAPKGLSHWNDHSRGLIRTLRPSASAWRASTMAH